MRHFLAICHILMIPILGINAQENEKNCHYGFTFEVSKNPSWGYGELVITDVEDNSPAEAAGIKVDDIIMEIDSKATYLRNNQTINQWLFDIHTPTITFTIRNQDTYFKEYSLDRKCINTNSVSEEDLASIFSLYSTENTSSRSFILPVNVEPNEKVDYTDYHTYDFYHDNNGITNTDKLIMSILESELKAKGFVRDTKDPDIIVQAYYNFDKNPKFSELNKNSTTNTNCWRYDSEKKEMVLMPIINPKESNVETKGQFVAEYGFSFYDRKYIKPDELTQIWDCNIKDYMSLSYSFDEYIRIHTPLMLKQFPYGIAKKEGEYIVNFNKYNYTGLYFDADNPSIVRDVDFDSPAYKAGIRAGYVIKKINDKKIESDKNKLSDGYKRFIAETTNYRDPSTRFTDANGFSDCMYWAPAYYEDIAKEFNKATYKTNFAYLYNFEPYVSKNPTNSLSIEAWDGMQHRLFKLDAETRHSVRVKTL